MQAWILWALFFGWQVAPAGLIYGLHANGLLSKAGTIGAAGLAVAGTGAAWYVALTDSSSTAPVLLMFSPMYLFVLVLLVAGADVGVRAAGRILRPR